IAHIAVKGGKYGNATKISIAIPKPAVENIANNNLGLAITSDIAKVTVSNKGVKNLDGNLCITAENKNDSVYIEVTVDGNVQNKIDGGVDITIPNNSQSKNAVLVIVGEDGSETAVKKAVLTKDGIKAVIKGSAIVKTADRVKAYPDTEKHWAENAIDFVTSREIFSGTENGFEPESTTSRAMLVTTLFRLEEAEAIGTQGFEDVSDDTWYTDAVVWASANKIAEGTGKGFEPDGNVTREQLCTIIYRYAENIGMDTDTENGFDNFKDKEEVSEWAKEAIGWAVNSGIVSGKPDELLDPQGYATRAEVAVIYQRLIGLMIK
ncbi:MAG: S-layer homology domain-containing protein, partial [Monoglobaceae bacterium]